MKNNKMGLRIKKWALRHIENSKLIEKQITEYLNGKRKKFELRFDPKGTIFQKKVWRVISKIPYGHTASYQTLAQLIKNPKAVRAVGTACGKNPYPILIPCHRVVSSNGSLGGYSGGLAIKKYLLQLESNK